MALTTQLSSPCVHTQLERLHSSVPKSELFFRLSPKMSKALLMKIHGAWLSKLEFVDFFQVATRSLTGAQIQH